MKKTLIIAVQVVVLLAISLAVSAVASGGRGFHPPDRATGNVKTGDIENGAITSAKIADGSVAPSDSTTALKTKTVCVNLDPPTATDQRYIFVAPYACTIVSVGLVCDVTTSSSNAGTNWSFQVANLTASSNLASVATNTAGTEITADTYYALEVDQNLTLTANDVLELQITSNGVPTSIGAAAELLGVVEYY